MVEITEIEEEPTPTDIEETEVEIAEKKVVKRVIKKKGKDGIDIEEITEIKEIPTLTSLEKSESKEKKVGKRVVKKKGKDGLEIEEITEVEVTKERKIKPKSPQTDEYEIDEELVEDMKPLTYQTQSQVPTNVPETTSEAVITGEVAQIDKEPSNQTAVLEIIPHTAISEEQIIAHETENSYEKIPLSGQTATEIIDDVKSIEVSEQFAQNIPGEFESIFKPHTSKATPQVEATEGISVEEIYAGDTPSQLLIKETLESQAIISLLPQEAKHVSETESAVKEGTLEMPTVESKQPMVLNTTNLYSEATSTSEVTHMDEITEKVEAKMNIIPHSAITSEETLPEEKEYLHVRGQSQTFSATKTFDVAEACETIQHAVQDVSKEFDGQPTTTYMKASPQLVQNESVVVEEVTTVNVPSELLPEEPQTQQSAFVALTPQEAKNITEVEVSDKEKQLETFKIPEEVLASQNFTMKEGISVEEVGLNFSEKPLETVAPVGVKPKYKLDSNESVVVEEISSEVKLGKHLPEAFVATEIAKKNIIPQRSVTQTQTVAPELEGEYVPGKLPPNQTASIGVASGESLIISQINTSEKENTFDAPTEVGKEMATTAFVLSEGVTVSVIDSQNPKKKCRLNNQKIKEHMWIYY